MKPIDPMERQSLKQQVIESIKQHIIEEELEANDKLPTERKFVELFGVSRSVVREALSYLENTGVVRVRQGQGTFLKESNIEQLLDNFFFLWQINNGDVRDILGLRLIFESSAIDEIITNQYHEAIPRLKKLVNTSRHVSTLDEFRAADMAFHSELLQVTNNQLFSQLTHVITHYFFHIQHVEITAAEYNTLTEEHVHIVDALEQGDAAKAKAILAAHIHQAKS